MSVLAALESIRSPFLNQVILLLTNLGDEAAVFAIGLFFFWCYDKRRGYMLIRTCFAALGGCFLLKNILCVPRPWVQDPSLNPVNVQASNANDFSMPSGHATNSASMYGFIGLGVKHKALKIVLLLMPLLVGFTRMYLGVHTPQDIVFGLVIGYGMAFIAHRLIDRLSDSANAMTWLDGGIVALLIGILIYLNVKTPADETQAACIASSIKDTCSLLGSMLGVLIAYPIEKKHIRFRTDAIWWAQVLKLVIGLGLAVALRTGLKPVMNLILPDCVYTNIVRYFALTFFAIAVWPMSFGWFAKLGRK